jgi:hypothetical protein
MEASAVHSGPDELRADLLLMDALGGGLDGCKTSERGCRV